MFLPDPDEEQIGDAKSQSKSEAQHSETAGFGIATNERNADVGASSYATHATPTTESEHVAPFR